MTTFCKTIIPKGMFKERETKGDRVVLRFNAKEEDGAVTCDETIVAADYSEDKVKADYEAWKAKREAARLQDAKNEKVRAILAYDVSDNVNSFTLKHGDVSVDYWLTAVRRNQLVTSVTAWGETHDDYTLDLREYNVSIDIPCNTLLAMLSELESYAVACYNATSKHVMEVPRLETIEEVEAYDYTADYPEKKVFTF